MTDGCRVDHGLLNAPIAQTKDANGLTTSGFGYINTATILSSSTSGMFNQRYGQLVIL